LDDSKTPCFLNSLFALQNQEIFRDYGFVEKFPQRWVFMHGHLRFDLDEDDKGEVQLVWLETSEHETSKPSLIQKWLSNEHTRLLHFRNMMNEVSIPVHEWILILEYYEAITNAVEYAINDMLKDSDEEDSEL
jgi:hypothetical protein